MDKNAVIKAAPLVEGGLVDREREVKEKLVESAVASFSISEHFTIDEIQQYIELRMDIHVDEAVVQSGLQKLEKQEVIEHVFEEQYQVISDSHITKFENLFEPVWFEFRDLVESSEYDRQIDYKLDNYKNALRDFFISYFKSVVDDSSNLHNHTEADINRINFYTAIESTCEENGLRDEAVFEELIKGYIEDQSETLQSFFGDIYIGVAIVDLLSRGQEMDLSVDNSGNKVLFLDTNAIIPLICISDNLYPLLSSVCKRSTELGYQLFYLPRTAEEMDRVVNKTQDNLSGFSPSGKSDPFDNQFIKDFQNREDISSPQNYKVYIGKWKNIVEEKYGITEFDKEISKEDADWDVIFGWVKEIDKLEGDGTKSTRQLRHDRDLVASVVELRPENREGPLVGPFGLTYNRNLLPINEIGRGEMWDHGVLVDPQGWLNYLISFTPAEFSEDIESEVAKAILTAAADFDDGFELDNYLEVLAAKSNIAEEDIGYMKEIILETPLSQELEDAARRGNGQAVEETGYEIIKGLEEYIRKEREKDEKLKHVSKTVQEEREEKKKERERRRELEEIIDNIQGIEVTTNVNQEMHIKVSQEIQKQYDTFVDDLRSNIDGELQDVGIPEPPQDRSDPNKLINWLEKVNTVLSTSDKISKNAQRLAPYAAGLLAQLS